MANAPFPDVRSVKAIVIGTAYVGSLGAFWTRVGAVEMLSGDEQEVIFMAEEVIISVILLEPSTKPKLFQVVRSVVTCEIIADLLTGQAATPGRTIRATTMGTKSSGRTPL